MTYLTATQKLEKQNEPLVTPEAIEKTGRCKKKKSKQRGKENSIVLKKDGEVESDDLYLRG